MKTINTEVFYRERMMVPPGSIVSVTLEDVSRMDAKAEILSKGEIETAGGPPYKVALSYDAATINEKMRYSLRATIKNSGKLLFTSTENLDPFKQQHTDEVKILVQRVGGSKAPKQADSSLTDTYWKADMLLGATVEPGAEGKELSMVLESEQNRVRGFSGCNGFSGTFMVQANSLRFDKMISTQMMCTKEMEQEYSFHQALSTSDRFKIQGEELLIFDREGNTIARFIAGSMQ